MGEGKHWEAKEGNSSFGCCVSVSGVNRSFVSEKYEVY